jgi:uncharacterized LabA/DUF88 family protein
MNVGILWDIENVIPPSNTNYIQSVLDIVSQNGRISYAMAFGDWNKDSIKNIAHELSTNNFELIHIPKAGKNSSDMSLVAHGVELIFQFPHIERFVLISGDGDFRPLLLSQKKYGKETWVICDVKNNASEDLLKMADKYFDYREIINIEETIENTDEEENHEEELSKSQAFELFTEAIGIMIKEKKIPNYGSVKIKMKLLNDQFNENNLNYNSWNSFVNDAIKNTGIIYQDNIFSFNNKTENTIPEIFKQLLNGIGNTNEWILFTKVAPKIDYKKFGYNRFKKLALDAEKRGYIEIKNKGLSWSLRKNM